MKQALLYDRESESRVRCRLCAHGCLIRPDDTGLCGVRRNQGGELYTLVYGRAVSANLDPIEKKPLFHFLPGSTSLSVATVGCNFACSFCQNHEISRMPLDEGRIVGRDLPPSEIVGMAKRAGAASISYTYTEPTIYFEYALDTARLAAREGLYNVFVTNGYMSEAALNAIDGDLHAANVDLKAFSDEFYKRFCHARLEPVKETIARMRAAGVWVEVTTLLIPDANDGDAELTALAEWLCGVDSGIPWHISRFHPTYRLLDRPPTPVASLRRARDIGLKAGLRHVYTGNVWGDDGEKTLCPSCGRLLIDRHGFTVRTNALIDGACPDCGAAAAGFWTPDRP